MSLRSLNGEIRESENIKRIVECHQNNRLSSFELYFLRGGWLGSGSGMPCMSLDCRKLSLFLLFFQTE